MDTLSAAQQAAAQSEAQMQSANANTTTLSRDAIGHLALPPVVALATIPNGQVIPVGQLNGNHNPLNNMNEGLTFRMTPGYSVSQRATQSAKNAVAAIVKGAEVTTGDMLPLRIGNNNALQADVEATLAKAGVATDIIRNIQALFEADALTPNAAIHLTQAKAAEPVVADTGMDALTNALAGGAIPDMETDPQAEHLSVTPPLEETAAEAIVRSFQG